MNALLYTGLQCTQKMANSACIVPPASFDDRSTRIQAWRRSAQVVIAVASRAHEGRTLGHLTLSKCDGQVFVRLVKWWIRLRDRAGPKMPYSEACHGPSDLQVYPKLDQPTMWREKLHLGQRFKKPEGGYIGDVSGQQFIDRCQRKDLFRSEALLAFCALTVDGVQIVRRETPHMPISRIRKLTRCPYPSDLYEGHHKCHLIGCERL